MKKWFARILILTLSVAAIICCMGMDVNCDGEFQGLSCSFDGCGSGCLDGCGECNHSYKIVEETESTCKEAGYVKYECKKCGHIDTQYKIKLEHEIVHSLHRGDCRDGADNGWYEEDKCANCDYVIRNTYCNSAVHLYDEGKTTYYEDGSGCGEITYTCLICGGTKTVYCHSEESPQLQEYKSRYENQQCGYYFKTCDLCGNYVDELWHKDYTSEVVVEPTQTEYGLKKYKCTSTASGSSKHCLYKDWEWYELIPPVTE